MVRAFGGKCSLQIPVEVALQPEINRNTENQQCAREQCCVPGGDAKAKRTRVHELAPKPMVSPMSRTGRINFASKGPSTLLRTCGM